MIYILDLLGTFVFAITGGLKAVKYNLDILGIIVLSIIVGVGGGVIRDLILGYNPPNVFRDEIYLIVCLAAGLLVFFFSYLIERKIRFLLIFDAVGLGVFALIGANRAASYDMGPLGVIMMGTITATGGGLLRDVLVREIPIIIKKDFYASAALVGCIFYLIADHYQLPNLIKIVMPILITTSLRLTAIIFNINLPKTKNISS